MQSLQHGAMIYSFNLQFIHHTEGPMFPTFDDVVRFHGHSCPGLAIGYRMVCAALVTLQALRSADEEIVAIVENNACGVDAVQYVAGCTFGKGNLVFRDYGKHAYTLYSRTTSKGVRVTFNGRGVPDGLREDRAAFAQWVLRAPEEALLSLHEVLVDEPEPARIHRSIACGQCGEMVMETRLKQIDGKAICIPCAQRHSAVKIIHFPAE
jgi:formylmethanofuran dehydrogenase subunit E